MPKHSSTTVWLAALLLAGLHSPVQAEQRSAQQNWQNSCVYCHTTGVGPDLLGRQLPEQMTVLLVRHGWRQMPAFRDSEISDTELTELARWLATQPATETLP